MRFSTVRQVGLFFGAAHSTAECSWLAYDINAGIVQHPLLVAILVPLRSYFFFFFWTYSRSVYSNLHLRTDAVHSRSLAHLFSSTRFTTIPFLLLLPTHAAPLSPEQLHHKLFLPVEEVPEPFPCCRHAILRLMGSKDYEVLQD